MAITKLFQAFFESEKAGGILLLLGTVLSLLLAESFLQAFYLGFWELSFAGHGLTHWINDGLMVIFFLLIGLELERKVYIGELSNLNMVQEIKNAVI
jgi:NhaA family Na+:H+ antiporter